MHSTQPEFYKGKNLSSQNPQSPQSKAYRTTNSFKNRHGLQSSLDSIWHESSTSLTREKSPSHKIPMAARFSSVQEDQVKNRQALTFQLRKKNSAKDVKFAKSRRQDHFLKNKLKDSPSPASYNKTRFMDETNYKTRNSKQLFYNPQERSYYNTLKQIVQKYNKTSKKGITIPHFDSHHKSYVDHTKHTFYQPQNTIEYPGVGQYDQNESNKKKNPSYSLRVGLKKFNEFPNGYPGPGAYRNSTSKVQSPSNQKGTFPTSKRTYLTNFNKNPSPNNYHVTRFLEGYN